MTRCFVLFALVVAACGESASRGNTPAAPAPPAAEPAPPAEAPPAPPAVESDPGDEPLRGSWAPRTPEEERATAVFLETARVYRDKACACPDKPCALAVDKELMVWITENMEAMKAARPTRKEKALAESLLDEMTTCQARLELR